MNPDDQALVDRARRIVVETQTYDRPTLKKRMRLHWSDFGFIEGELERQGVISRPNPRFEREVLVKK